MLTQGSRPWQSEVPPAELVWLVRVLDTGYWLPAGVVVIANGLPVSIIDLDPVALNVRSDKLPCGLDGLPTTRFE